jgi:hypothetical protein
VQKYELLLNDASLARAKLEGLRERLEQHMAKSGETLRQVKTTVDRLCEETEGQLLEFYHGHEEHCEDQVWEANDAYRSRKLLRLYAIRRGRVRPTIRSTHR